MSDNPRPDPESETIWDELAKHDPHVQDDPNSTTLSDLPNPTGLGYWPGVPILEVMISVEQDKPRRPSTWPLWAGMAVNAAAVILNLLGRNWWLAPVNLACIGVLLFARHLGLRLARACEPSVAIQHLPLKPPPET